MTRFETIKNKRGDHRSDDARSKWGDFKLKCRLWHLFQGALAVFWILLVVSVQSAQAGGVGEQASGFSLPALSGGEIGLEAYQGKVVLLNFWASWCSPCKEELPELEQLHLHFHDHGFEVVGINIDKKQKNALKIVERFGLSFPVLLDPNAEVIQRYPGRAMPISYLIDQEGAIRNVFFGFNRKKLPQMRASIKELVNEK